jgi:hypothetical protein
MIESMAAQATILYKGMVLILQKTFSDAGATLASRVKP